MVFCFILFFFCGVDKTTVEISGIQQVALEVLGIGIYTFFVCLWGTIRLLSTTVQVITVQILMK